MTTSLSTENAQQQSRLEESVLVCTAGLHS